MAKVTWIIGNGFDINIGLKTRYTDFYKVYTIVQPGDNAVIQRFKKEILKDEAYGWQNWADFEMGFGKQSKQFDGGTAVEDFLSCYSDFVKCFHSYLESLSLSIKWNELNNDMLTAFMNGISSFSNHITTVQRSIPQAVIHTRDSAGRGIPIENSFIQFNYTNVFDELLLRCGINSDNNFHVHGALNMNPIIGVDNSTQIDSDVINNDDRVKKIFIKQGYLSLLQKRNVNIPIPAKKALSFIASGDAICVFGASIGESDLYWWRKVGDRLGNSKCILIIFDVCGQTSDNIDPIAVLESELSIDERRSEIIDRFLSLSGLGADWAEKNENRIIVELDRPVFSFKLPLSP